MTTDVDALRSFNRRWTAVLGLLDRHLLDSPYSLPEARVLYELAAAERTSRSTDVELLSLRRRLGIDASFLTRVTGRLERAGLIDISPSPTDGRRRQIRLTPAGRAAAADLDERSTGQIARLLDPLSADQRRVLAESTTLAAALVDATPTTPIALRPHGPGDLGWIVQRHGALYADEYGWDGTFETLVATIVGRFDATTDRAWIAEVAGARAGSVMYCRPAERTGQLRLLLVEPWARGLGLGRRLVDACIDHARSRGDTSLVLWTNDVLVAARAIYQAAGFELVAEESHHSFGHDLVGQDWRLDLRASSPSAR
jgi:DNA-binding MarR family transcriptional regulator/ribosomal protein S18 acetylase RimI-like enzyme